MYKGIYAGVGCIAGFVACINILFSGMFDANQAPPILSDISIEEHFVRDFGCHWLGPPSRRTCVLAKIGGSLELVMEPSLRKVKTIELIALVVDHQGRRIRELKSQAIVLQIMNYFLPGWKQSRSWMASALERARNRSDPSFVIVNGMRIAVNQIQPADIDDTFADIFVFF